MAGAIVLLTACTLPPLESRTPSPSPTATAAPTATASPSPGPATPSAEPTPDPFLRTTGRTAEGAPFIVAMAATGDTEQGPIQIGEGDHAIRWIARDPEAVRCSFAVSLAPPSGDPVRTILATVGGGVDRGTLQPQTFASLGVRGTAFVSVGSDCTWALVMLRVPDPDPDPSTTP